MAGGLLQWLGGSRGRNTSAPIADELEDAVLPDGLVDQIQTVEDAALDIYARHGLPLAQGNYVQRGEDAAWEPLADNLTPTEKWDLLEEAPPHAHWRFTDRAGLGRHSAHPEVQRASILLAACSGLRARIDGKHPTTAQDVADALQLGAAAAWLQAAAPTSSANAVEQDSYAPLTFMPLPGPTDETDS